MVHRGMHQSGRVMGVALVAAAFLLIVAGQAQAATPLVQISSDPYTNTTSYHQTQVEPDDFAFGTTIVATFQSGRFFDGGASNLGFATSTDRGAHWTTGFLPGTTVYSTPPGTYARISDPSVGFDPKHNVWIITGLAIDAGVNGKAVVAGRSTDGGLTWQNAINVSVAGGGAFYDKDWIGCDTVATSPNYGNCYVEWDNANAGERVMMSRSTDGGLTWQTATVPSQARGLGGQPVAQPNGTVVVPFFGNGMQSIVSTDGGTTYTGPFTISSQSDHAVGGGLRSEPLPSAEVDGAGNVYTVWHDCRFRASCSSNDIVMSTSADGKTWSAVSRIPIDATTSTVDHFIPGIGVDRSTSGATARLALTYYYYPKANCGTNSCKLTIGYVSSTNGGATWSPPMKLGGPIALGGIAPTSLGPMVGDYVSTAITNGKAYPVVVSATGSSCSLASVTACTEFAQSTAGLAVRGGTLSSRDDRVVTAGHASAIAGRTAF